MKAKVPFEFYTSSRLVEITGKRASDLKEFVEILKNIDDSSIFYHVHHALREHQFAPGLYTNDFAHWIDEGLGESSLAEKLANIDVKDCADLKSLREKIIEIIEEFLKKAGELRKVTPGREFYFCKSIGVIQKTNYVAWDLKEFCEMLKKVGRRSIFFHFFEARLRLNHKVNDFSNWFKFNFGAEDLARKIDALDPYLYTMDEFRDRVISLICREKMSFWGKVVKWLKLK